MLKRLFKTAAANAALLIYKKRIAIAAAAMAMGSLLTVAVATAAPNLIRNADFTAITYDPAIDDYTVDNWVDPGFVQVVWNTVSSAIVGPDNSPRFTSYHAYQPPNFPPALRAITATPGWTVGSKKTDPYYYQVINGLIPGHIYEVSFSNSSGVKSYTPGPRSSGGTTSPYFGAMPWQVTFKGASGTQTQIGSTPPAPQPNEYFDTKFPMVKTVLRFLAGDTSAKLGFSPVTWDLPCIPCYTVQENLLNNLQMVDAGPAATSPTLTVQKALGTGGRANNADQFKVSILNAATSAVLGSGNTAGTGSTVTGGLASITGDSATRYKVVEEMLPGSVSNLTQYNASLSCTNANSAGTQFPAGTVSLGQNFPLLVAGDQVSCTVTNTAKPVTLQVRQMVLSPVPVNLKPPFTFSYTGNNGWSAAPLTNTSLNTVVSSAAVQLTATNTSTTVSTTLPEPRWFVSSFNCTDTNAAITGNPTGNLATSLSTSVTVPAANVRSGAALRCTLLMGHYTP